MNKNTVNALMEVLNALVDAVRVTGKAGCPEGTLYATLMGHGCTLNQFNSIIGALVSAGRLRKEGHVLYAD